MKYKTVAVGGVELLYREAGEPGKPKVVLIGGFPSSSHQWQTVQNSNADEEGFTPTWDGIRFTAATAPDHVMIRSEIGVDDPLADALDGGGVQLGLLVLEPESRNRIRLNGTAHLTRCGLELDLTEAFGHCPKYIQRRTSASVSEDPTRSGTRVGEAIDADQSEFVGHSDTFFVAPQV